MHVINYCWSGLSQAHVYHLLYWQQSFFRPSEVAMYANNYARIITFVAVSPFPSIRRLLFCLLVVVSRRMTPEQSFSTQMSDVLFAPECWLVVMVPVVHSSYGIGCDFSFAQNLFMENPVSSLLHLI